MNDETVSQARQTPIRFCQNCGRGLDEAASRIVGNAVFCEPCLEARLNGGSPAGGFANTTSTADAGPAYTPVSSPADSNVPPPWQPAGGPSLPNPGLAALLGFIPGVGAMYNGQYAKGIVHLIVFTVLVSLTNATDIFLIFVFGWEAYMAIEAHHTAKARRDGLPLPNPFNLNDIGERLGFGKSWPAGAGVGEAMRDASSAVRSGFAQGAAPTAQPGYQAPPATSWGAPADQPPTPNPYHPSTNPYAEQVPASGPWNPGYATVGNTPPAPFSTQNYPGTIPPYLPPVSRFPAGAVWLIGLGAFFLLATTGVFHIFPAHALIGCVLIGLGIWSFLSRMSESGAGLLDDGSGTYSMRLYQALRVAVWLVLAGIAFLLNAAHLISFQRSWPLFVILAGVMTLIERSVAQSTFPPPPLPAQPAPSYPAQPVSYTPEDAAPVPANATAFQQTAEPKGDH